MDKLIKEAARAIAESRYAVAFTGAGVSVESGIPPFRGAGGLWEEYDPVILDLGYFSMNPEEAWKAIKRLFYDFFGSAKPNDAHKILAKWEQQDILKSIITQNIDNLHQEAGNKLVYEFHGTAQSMVCLSCKTKFLSEKVDLSEIPPKCDKCNSVLKPDFVFFGEGIPPKTSDLSFEAANKCDLMLVIGTTGEVMPASMIPDAAKRAGATIIEINPNPSNFTHRVTDIFLEGRAGNIMPMLADYIENIR